MKVEINDKYTKIPNELIYNSGLSNSGFKLICFLLSLNDYKKIYPAYKKLGAVGAPGTVRKAIDELESRKIIRCKSSSRGFKGVVRKANEYLILPREQWILGNNQLTESESIQNIESNKTEGQDLQSLPVIQTEFAQGKREESETQKQIGENKNE